MARTPGSKNMDYRTYRAIALSYRRHRASFIKSACAMTGYSDSKIRLILREVDKENHEVGEAVRQAVRNRIISIIPKIRLEPRLRYSKDVIEKFLKNCDGNRVNAAERLGLSRGDFYKHLKAHGIPNKFVGLKRQKETYSKGDVLRALDSCDGNRVKASESLGVSRAIFYNLLKAYGIPNKSVSRRAA